MLARVVLQQSPSKMQDKVVSLFSSYMLLNVDFLNIHIYLIFIFWWERERKHQFVVPLIYAFISWFLYVPWWEMEPATLVYWDDALTNWAISLGLRASPLTFSLCSLPFKSSWYSIPQSVIKVIGTCTKYYLLKLGSSYITIICTFFVVIIVVFTTFCSLYFKLDDRFHRSESRTLHCISHGALMKQKFDK